MDDDFQQRPLRIDESGPEIPFARMTGGRRPANVVSLREGAGRMPPQAVDVEQAVLGAVLIERDAIPKAIEILPADAFYDGRHQKIYEAVEALFERGHPVDLITLSEELKRRGEYEAIGGYYLAELTTRVASAANVEYHARIIAEKSLLRKLITTMTGVVGQAFDPTTDAFDLLDEAERQIFQITESQLRKGVVKLDSVMMQTVAHLESIHGREGGITGVPSGFTALDNMTGGWQPSDMVIVAARPSMGKCLGRGTRVMMHDGTLRAVEDVRVGDLLMGDDSAPRRVLSLARGREEMVWVRQTYGMDYRVNASHILSVVKSRSGDPEARGTVTDIEVRDYMAHSPKWQNDHKGYKVGVEFPEQDVPLDPYFLGLRLGTEALAASRLSAQRHPERVEGSLPSATRSWEHLGAWDFSERALSHQRSFDCAREDARFAQDDVLDVAAVVPVGLSIPHVYLANSRAARLALLAGLVDSDGHRSTGHGGTYEITQTNERLARQIKHLCDTLGLRTSLRSKIARCQTGATSTVWRVRFNGDVSDAPIRVARIGAPEWADFRDWRVSGLRLEPDGVDDYFGFTIDGNRRFLLEDGTVTHNTAFSLALTRNAALHPEKPTGVAYFSLEMSAQQLAQRLLTSEARVDAQRARTGRLHDDDWPKLARAAGKLSAAPIFIDDTPALGILELRAKCRRLKAEHDIGIVIVDYLQLMHGTQQTQGNREQEIAQISRSLKGLAKELDVPVIALAQLSRAVETRGGDKRPQLSDLRESGCLTGDTLVPLADTGRRVPIRDLVGRDDAVVWASDPETLRVCPARVSRAFSTGTKPVYRLTTASGRTIRATANHKFLTIGGWSRLDEIEAGAHVALPRALGPAPEATMTRDELALLGHLIGDGCTLPRHAIQYTTREEDLAAHVAGLASAVFGDAVAPRIVHETPEGRDSRWIQVYLASTRKHTHGVRSAVSEWLDRLGAWGLRSHEKHVPEAVFEQPAESVAHFLRHLWATDGCIRLVAGTSPRAAIYYASSSERLARDVQSLLLRVGIVARLSRVPQREKGRDQFHVIVSGRPDVLRFADTVGAVGAYKGASLADVRAFAEARVENTNRDVIPRAVWRRLVTPAMAQGGMTTRQMQADLGTAFCGTTLYKANLSRARAAAVAAIVGSEALAALAGSDLYWDAVVSIVPDGAEETFDLTVPGPHNFVANDIVVHNSIEQDADVVMFIYRAERYGITVDEAGNSTEGLGELLIGKQRNGPIGDVKVAFVNQFARFENLTSYAQPDTDGGYGDPYGQDPYGGDGAGLPPFDPPPDFGPPGLPPPSSQDPF